MAALIPHWSQPSHPSILSVIHASADRDSFSSRSISQVTLPAGAVFAALSTPPLTPAKKAYSTVQTSATTHVELNSDLVYINHSCAPSLEFDIARMEIRVARDIKGGTLNQGQELTFFYPSTEWDMAQPFDCHCGEEQCRGTINGAGQMSREKLEGYWFNEWVEKALQEKWASEEGKTNSTANGHSNGINGKTNGTANGHSNGINGKANGTNGVANGVNGIKNGTHRESNGFSNGNGHFPATPEFVPNGKVEQPAGAQRQGASARELAGEMGGDTM
ncbi:hypothetical protein BZA05DRAFT_388112 [Tricharina praecox]|uniref:uncharacterized protein n=1 Tax=Tricharina praecox TaxID=43433 RepID=UPI00222011AA|nr:uncharacterized protein BZA05DRAFT_388112 [Tricharina praecox]KAI5856324.1 hypothetical protein BZA05DRAFT_388112 [Tricharina praecox]